MPGERAPVGSGRLTQPQELPEGRVGVGEALGQRRGGPGEEADRVLDAVQGHGPHPAREQVGVGQADERPGRLAQEGEPAVAHQLPQVVQVPDRVGGGDVGQQLAVTSAASLRQLDGLGQVAPLVRAGGGHGLVLPEAGPLGRVGKAADRGAAPGAPRVPADDVEAAAGLRVQGIAAAGDHRHPGVARSTRVDEQRPDPLVGPAGQVPDHRKRDRRPARVAPSPTAPATLAHSSRGPHAVQLIDGTPRVLASAPTGTTIARTTKAARTTASPRWVRQGSAPPIRALMA